MPYSKKPDLRELAAFKNHNYAKRKKINMNDAWWEKMRIEFFAKDSQKANSMGFAKSEAEIQKDWEEYKKLLIEENTTYIDIYDSSADKLDRLFHKRVEDLKTAARLTRELRDIVELMTLAADNLEKREKNKDKLRKLMTKYEFEGLENEITGDLYLSSLTGWEIDAHIAAEDFELVK